MIIKKLTKKKKKIKLQNRLNQKKENKSAKWEN